MDMTLNVEAGVSGVGDGRWEVGVGLTSKEIRQITVDLMVTRSPLTSRCNRKVF